MVSIGKPVTWDECWDLVHAIARRLLGRERHNHTLGATDVVGEVFLRCGEDPPDWRSDAALRAYFSRIVRHVLVDYARRKGAVKRGGTFQRVELDPALIWHEDDPGNVLIAEEWVRRLEAHDHQLARMVTMKVFGGMKSAEIGEALGLQPHTVRRALERARLFLERDMRRVEDGVDAEREVEG